MGELSQDTPGLSSHLFTVPSFLRGAGRAVDICASYRHVSYNVSRTGRAADITAMRADAAALKADMRKVLDRVREEVGRPQA